MGASAVEWRETGDEDEAEWSKLGLRLGLDSGVGLESEHHGSGFWPACESRCVSGLPVEKLLAVGKSRRRAHVMVRRGHQCAQAGMFS